jgi:large subunit ribosomal protein L3
MLVVYTQPKEVMIGKKKPELFEVAIGGTVADQLKYATAKMGKEIPVTEVFSTGSIVDIHAVTTGRGLQGSVKRFGVAIRAHKSEKTKRGVGSTAGGWSAQQHTMYRVAKAGQTGYHTRTEYNKKIMLIDSDATKVNPKGGFIRYGEVKNTYVLIKGSVAGPEKRMIRFNKAIRVANMKTEVPKIEYISVESKQN